VKVELTTRTSDLVRVEMTQERFRSPALAKDEDVIVSLKETQFFRRLFDKKKRIEMISRYGFSNPVLKCTPEVQRV
jgi:hypothetical protein